MTEYPEQQLCVLPDGDCRRLHHPDPVAHTLPTGDRLAACPLCTIAYRRVLDELGDARLASAFVLALRSDAEPISLDDDHDDNEQRT